MKSYTAILFIIFVSGCSSLSSIKNEYQAPGLGFSFFQEKPISLYLEVEGSYPAEREQISREVLETFQEYRPSFEFFSEVEIIDFDATEIFHTSSLDVPPGQLTDKRVLFIRVKNYSHGERENVRKDKVGEPDSPREKLVLEYKTTTKIEANYIFYDFKQGRNLWKGALSEVNQEASEGPYEKGVCESASFQKHLECGAIKKVYENIVDREIKSSESNLAYPKPIVIGSMVVKIAEQIAKQMPYRPCSELGFLGCLKQAFKNIR